MVQRLPLFELASKRDWGEVWACLVAMCGCVLCGFDVILERETDDPPGHEPQNDGFLFWRKRPSMSPTAKLRSHQQTWKSTGREDPFPFKAVVPTAHFGAT